MTKRNAKSQYEIAEYEEIAYLFDIKRNRFTLAQVKKKNQKCWWRCPVGQDHVWYASCSDVFRSRFSKSKGCRFCRGLEASSTNNIELTHPKIAAQFDHTKNGMLKPKQLTYGSTKEIHWLCDKGHSWEQKVRERCVAPSAKSLKSDKFEGLDCPYCNKTRASPEYNLLTEFPELAQEWDWERNGDLTMEEFLPSSHVKVWWKCRKGHSFDTKISLRTKNKNGCRFCTNQTSKPEIRIYCELVKLFSKVLRKSRVGKYEADILLPNHKVAIEYDGAFFHKNRFAQDKKKTEYFFQNDLSLIRVRPMPLNRISKADILIDKDEVSKDTVNLIIKQILLITKSPKSAEIKSYLKNIDFTNDELFNQLCEDLPDPPIDASVAKLYANLNEEWDYDKNHPLTPKSFTPGSSFHAHWICKKYGHKWSSNIANRTLSGAGCPICSGNVPGPSDNFQTDYPNLAKHWHANLNAGKSPSDFTSGSNFSAYWICSNLHVEKKTIKSVVRAGDYTCKRCNSLGFSHPNLVAEIHPLKNGNIDPFELAKASGKKIWWVCNKNHEFETSINNRTRSKNPSGCPHCFNERQSNKTLPQ